MIDNKIRPEPLPVSVFAHRGASGYEPENTLKAFKKALDIGAHGIELDVHLINDELLVFHSGETAIKYRKNNTHIPSLEQVIDLVNCRAVLNIELKGDGTALPVTQLIESYIDKNGWRYSNFLISSFEHKWLEVVRKNNGYMPIAPLVRHFKKDCLDTANKLNAYSINISRKVVNADVVSDVHEKGFKIYVYTVNTTEEIIEMNRIGVDGVFTNFPDKGMVVYGVSDLLKKGDELDKNRSIAGDGLPAATRGAYMRRS